MKKLINGNEATFLGAVKAGATFFAGYPITPSTEILIQAAELNAKNPNFKFIQSEDEMAAANAVIGASLAGAKAFTATSGPGFSLMQETIGYGHQLEVPAVYINVMRVGPATGMPTRPSQHDILQQWRLLSPGFLSQFGRGMLPLRCRRLQRCRRIPVTRNISGRCLP